MTLVHIVTGILAALVVLGAVGSWLNKPVPIQPGRTERLVRYLRHRRAR